MPPKKRVNWAAVSGVCIGIGLLAMLGALLFVVLGKPSRVDPGSALSEMGWVEPTAIRIGAVGANAPPDVGGRGASPPLNEPAVNSDVSSPYAAQTSARPTETPTPTPPAVVVLAAIPGPTATATGTPTTPAPSATTVGATAEATPVETLDTAATEQVPADPPPGAEFGVTYCGATTCTVGFKCCCDGCVPFEQACDPRSCEAQVGLSISVPCGMDLCDPGEVCCDARCGECALMGECPEEPCN